MEKINGMKFIAEIPLKKNESIVNHEKIGEKYWLLYSQTELFALNFETMEMKRAIKNKNMLHIL